MKPKNFEKSCCSFTRTYNALQEHIKENRSTEARAAFNLLTKDCVKLREKDDEILTFLISSELTTDDELEIETATAAEYETKYEVMSVVIHDLENSASSRSVGQDDNRSQVSGVDIDKHKTLKLPPVNIGTFDGELKNWLPFWGQFEQIHEDENIPTFHKFRVLLQGTKEGTRARQIVESFPPSKDKATYEAAVTASKERFGREDLLIEVYIRELLSIIISNSKWPQFSLVDMYDKIEGHLRFLEILGVTSGKCAAILCPLLESCMPEEFLRVWQRSYVPDEVKGAEQRLTKFREFIKSEVQNEQRISLAMSKFGINGNHSTERKGNPNRHENSGKWSRRDIPTATGLLTTNQNKRSACIFCEQSSHESIDCYVARDMPLEHKLQRVRDMKCCYLCLKKSHSSKFCRVKTTCPLCDRKHDVILCPNYSHCKFKPHTSEKSTASNVSGASSGTETNPVKVASNASLTCDTSVLLPTVRVNLRGRNGNTLTVRAVFDTAAQRSYILNSTAERLKYTIEGQETLFHSLFGGRTTGMSRHNKYRIQIAKRKGSQMHTMDVLGQDEICGNLPTVPKGPWIEEMASCGLDVSDILEDSGPIELLIGADVACSFYTGNIKRFSGGLLVGVETVLGWTISGKLPAELCKTTLGMLSTSMLVSEMNVADLWKLEVLGIEDPVEKKTKSELQAQVQSNFLETLKVNEEGRYEVSLPWKEEHSPLPSNYDIALKRMNSTYTKLENDGYLKEYNNVFQEWINEGVIEEVPSTEPGEGGHYLPHRHIVKLNSTTKIRPVFDASAHQKDAPSLNMCLEKGCNLVEQIPPLLHRFRMNEVGVIADIRKAFLQIAINVHDRNFLLFLWRDAGGNLKVYCHKRVVFGLTSSPFLLGAVIQTHLIDILNKIETGKSVFSKLTIETLLKCFYVDNAVTSFSSREDVDRFVIEATSAMADGKFELRGWEYSDSELAGHTETPVLGLSWDRKDDTLSLSKESLKQPDGKITKRLIMSVAHKIFDPIGFVSPVTLYRRLLMQELWGTKLGWDDDVPQHIRDSFLQWADELHYLKDVRIPRWLPNMSNVSHWSMHTFCDASETSYAAVIFLRVENTHGVNVQLIQAKSRVAPKATIPRKELLAATIGARLYTSVRESIDVECGSYFWSDSSTVLAWLNREENWAPFVSNRVKELRRLTNAHQWHHVPGTLNPADLPSRGCRGKAFVESIWWEGPEWLYQQRNHWPCVSLEYNEELISRERRKTAVSSMVSTNAQNGEEKDWYYRFFSQYQKLIRMIAWTRRFINNCRSIGSDCYVRKKGPLSLEEMNEAELKILKMVQKEAFDGVEDPKISPLRPFEDHTGLIRLKTKISNRPDSEDFRYPILLPKGHPVVIRLIQSIHERECHVGVQGLLAFTRERFWILGGRRVLKSVISQCVICKRHDTKRLEAPTIPLPLDRVRKASAFEVVGVDLAGPIYLKKQRKAWICLFTCGVTRAIHLELLLSLSTDDFLQALRRFIARRGRPARIYSDQGSNFIGANNAIQKIDWYNIVDFCGVQKISWKFNPPTAAWWGGWWERLVGLTKRLLRKVLRRSTLSYSEMETVLCDCESVLNSRPLTLIAEGCSEATAISPSLFIQDIREAGMPELDSIESVDLRKSVQRRWKLKQDLRARFRSEYLVQLRMWAKKTKQDEIHVGDIVLIGNDGSKRTDWPLAKVTELLPGKEGTVHLVRLVTSSGQCLRLVQRLYRLLEGQEFYPEDCSPENGNSHDDPTGDERTPLIQSEESSIDIKSPEDELAERKSTSRGRLIKKPARFCD